MGNWWQRARSERGVPLRRVSSWTELDEALSDRSWGRHPGDIRASVVYRGSACEDWPVQTSLSRTGSPTSVEHHLLENFRKYAPTALPERQTTWDWLSLAQHHGLPTRLLDWTYSPYVALHFATANVEHADRDGAVWCVDYGAVHRLLPPRLRAPLRDTRMFSTVTLAQGAADLAELDALGGTDVVALFFEPPSLDQRIVTQAAVFSLLSAPGAQLSDWLEAHRGVWRKVVFPARLKPEIRERLDQANITERVLFPGLDGLALWLARYYGGGQTDDVSGLRRLPGVATKSA